LTPLELGGSKESHPYLEEMTRSKVLTIRKTVDRREPSLLKARKSVRVSQKALKGVKGVGLKS